MLKPDIDANGRLIIKQEVTAPTVYLDLFALMNIALNNNWENKFKTAIANKKGTLLFSWIHLLEFSDVTDKKQIKTMELFLDSLLDNLGFIDVVPKVVIEKENQKLQGNHQINPPGDERLLAFFGGINMRGQSLKPLTFDEILTKFNHPAIISMKKNFHLKFNSSIKKLQEKRQKDKKYSAKIKNLPKRMNLRAATRYIDYDILNSFIRENKIHTQNGWRDFYHTVVPLAYCDYLLLDKEFANKAQQAVNKLTNNNYTAQTAKVFSDIDKFLIDFEK